MLDRDIRAAILKLAAAGHGKKTIARALGISRKSVAKVLASGQSDVPPMDRGSRLDDVLDRVVELQLSCKGNLVRVHEELVADGVEVAYQTLTAFCREHEIGIEPKVAAGRYDFAPGVEMQHDTSPHEVTIAGRKRSLHCASLILCFSRKQYAQLYERWSRLECRHFVSEGIVFLGGAGSRCMLDNASVIIASGTGKNAVPAPAMAALGDRFGFKFVAHAVGDADRSGKVERVFLYIETNFYPGRTFSSLADLNAQLRQWCERNLDRVRRHLGASPAQLFRMEQPCLKPLPLHVPEVYQLHERRVDVEGYVNLHTNRYSMPARWIHRRVEVRETVDRVRILHGHQLLAEHDKLSYGKNGRVTLPEHRGIGRRKPRKRPPTEEERLLRTHGPELNELADILRRKHGGRAVKAMRRLHHIWRDYPAEPVQAAVAEALKYGLTDLERIERMVLRRIAGDFFCIPVDEEDDNDE